MIKIEEGIGTFSGHPVVLMAELMTALDQLDERFGEGSKEREVLRKTIADWVRDPMKMRREAKLNG